MCWGTGGVAGIGFERGKRGGGVWGLEPGAILGQNSAESRPAKSHWLQRVSLRIHWHRSWEVHRVINTILLYQWNNQKEKKVDFLTLKTQLFFKTWYLLKFMFARICNDSRKIAESKTTCNVETKISLIFLIMHLTTSSLIFSMSLAKLTGRPF